MADVLGIVLQFHLQLGNLGSGQREGLRLTDRETGNNCLTSLVCSRSIKTAFCAVWATWRKRPAGLVPGYWGRWSRVLRPRLGHATKMETCIDTCVDM